MSRPSRANQEKIFLYNFFVYSISNNLKQLRRIDIYCIEICCETFEHLYCM